MISLTDFLERCNPMVDQDPPITDSPPTPTVQYREFSTQLHETIFDLECQLKRKKRLAELLGANPVLKEVFDLLDA